MLTQDYLKSRLYYHPETGQFVRLESKHRHDHVGRVAGVISDNGYIRIRINDKLYLAHRLAFLYMTGSIPKMCDHINRIRHDNL